MKSELKARIRKSVKEILPSTTKTWIWIIKLTVGVSFGIELLKYFQILPWISSFLFPVFKYFGLPGDAALAYVTGYFVNVYSAVAVMSSLDLGVRATTILGTMLLCSHSMIIETAVIKKTGASGVRTVIVRTISAFVLGFVLNKILPQTGETLTAMSVEFQKPEFWPMMGAWALSTLKLCAFMTVIIFGLNILQRLLSEFGVIAWIFSVCRRKLHSSGLLPIS